MIVASRRGSAAVVAVALVLLVGWLSTAAAETTRIVSEPPPGTVIVDKVFVGDVTLVDDATIRIFCEQVPSFGDEVFDETITIPAGTTSLEVAVEDIPAPADCLVEEVDDGSSEAADITVAGLPAEFRLNPNEEYQQPVVNEITTLTGSLAVVKVSAGNAAADRDDVVVEVACTDPGGTTTVVTLDLISGRPVTGGSADVVAGSTCTVTELDDGAPPGVDVGTTGSPRTVTITEDELSIAVLTNTYTAQPGEVEVVKVIEGPTALRDGAVSIDLVCDGVVVTTLDVPAAAGTGTFSTTAAVPAGQTCTVVETADGASADAVVLTSVDPASVVAVAGGTSTITMTNTYSSPRPDPAVDVVVTKVLDGDVGRQGPVKVVVDCGGRRGVIALEAGATAGASVTVTDVDADDATCTITELLDGSSDAVSVVTSGEGTGLDPATGPFTVTNTYTLQPASLRVVKAAVGEAAGDRGAVTIDVDCSDGSSTTATTAAGDAFDDLVLTGIEDGALCTVTEPGDGGTDQVAATSAVLPRAISVTAGREAVVLVANSYAYRTGTLVVAAALRGNAEPFRDPVAITIDCEGEDEQELAIPVGERVSPVVLGGLRYGTACTVTQLDDGDTPDITTTTAPATTQTVTIDAPVEVLGVVDTYTAAPGSLTVTKVLSGDSRGREDVTVEVACDGVVQTETIAATAGSATFVVDGLLPGSTCVVTEPQDGGSDVLGVTTTFDPGDVVVVGPGAAAAVTVTNDYAALPVVGRDVAVPAGAALALLLLGSLLVVRDRRPRGSAAG